MQVGSGGQLFLDRWLKHSEGDKANDTCKDCSYWSWYGKQRNVYPGQWVFSFARMMEDEHFNQKWNCILMLKVEKMGKIELRVKNIVYKRVERIT